MRSDTILEVKNLKMYYSVRGGYVKAVDDVSFFLDRGATVGIVGESGCGKTSVALSIMSLLPVSGRILGGQVLFEGMDLLKLSREEMRKMRWRKISMIFQSAINALDPVYKVGDQLIEALRTNRKMGKTEALKRVEEVFDLVGLKPSRMWDYPHMFSAGMRQRVIIAMSLINEPNLIIADEPVTALDVLVQDQILAKIEMLQEKLNLSMVVISHDIAMMSELCDKMIVMYGGKIVESANTESMFETPRHPYTIGLIHSVPSIRGEIGDLETIPGAPPSLLSPPSGCLFHPRCPYAQDVCRKVEPSRIEVDKGHWSYCHFALDIPKAN
jgi:peptide/nickel transport system ATP-binding protein